MNFARPVCLALGAFLITGLSACDNVDWGGAEVVVVQPPPRAGDAPAETDADVPARIPDGPVLYHVRADDDGSATLTPVAEIAGQTLRRVQPGDDPEEFGRRYIAQHFREGSEFALFRDGQRVGTLGVQSVRLPDGTICPDLPRASGVPELVAGADTAAEFIALAKAHAPDPRMSPFDPYPAPTRLSVVAPILAERAFRGRGAPLPGSWQTAMAQAEPFPLTADGEAGFAATFLVSDSLGPGGDAQGHSVFYIAEPLAQSGYDTVYIAYTDYEREGKAAPRVVDFLDWDADDSPDLLLEVYGTERSWFEALGRTADGWRRTLENPCRDRSIAAAAPPTVPDTGTESTNP